MKTLIALAFVAVGPVAVALATTTPTQEAPPPLQEERDVTAMRFVGGEAEAGPQPLPAPLEDPAAQPVPTPGASRPQDAVAMPPLPADIQAKHRASGSRITLYFAQNTLAEVCSVLSASIGRPVINRANAAVLVTRTYMGMPVREVLDDLTANYPITFKDDDRNLIMEDLVPASVSLRPKLAIAKREVRVPVASDGQVPTARMRQRKGTADPLQAAELAKERWELLAERAGVSEPTVSYTDPKAAAAAALAKERWELLSERVQTQAVPQPSAKEQKKRGEQW